MSTIEREKNQEWRKSEFVVSYSTPGGPDRGRMRGTVFVPDAVLHRATCPTLSVERRCYANNPSDVWATTPEEHNKNRNGAANKRRTCKVCCKDLLEAKPWTEQRAPFTHLTAIAWATVKEQAPLVIGGKKATATVEQDGTRWSFTLRIDGVGIWSTGSEATQNEARTAIKKSAARFDAQLREEAAQAARVQP